MKDANEEPVFKNFVCLAKLVLILPHSNAETERIFSMLTDSKTKKKNKMGPELLNAILVTKSGIVARGEDCRNMAVKHEHYKLQLCIYVFIQIIVSKRILLCGVKVG